MSTIIVPRTIYPINHHDHDFLFGYTDIGFKCHDLHWLIDWQTDRLVD